MSTTGNPWDDEPSRPRRVRIRRPGPGEPGDWAGPEAPYGLGAEPPAAGPYDSEPYDMSVTGRDLRDTRLVVNGAGAAGIACVDLMKAMLSAHPELREAFHGLWVYANAANERPFANELPMSQIQ